MDRLDDIVVSESIRQVLEKEHLQDCLSSSVFGERLTCLSHAHTEVRSSLARLLELAEEDLMDAEDRNMREHLALLKVKWDALHRQIADVQKQISSARPPSP